MRPLLPSAVCLLIMLTATTIAAAAEEAAWPWLDVKANVLPTGELKWKPEPFVYQPGPSVRYIDFDAGDDANAGTREKPWKHHPWDPAAKDKAAACTGIHTYVFRCGVIYRGALVVKESGDAGQSHPPDSRSDLGQRSGDASPAPNASPVFAAAPTTPRFPRPIASGMSTSTSSRATCGSMPPRGRRRASRWPARPTGASPTPTTSRASGSSSTIPTRRTSGARRSRSATPSTRWATTR